MARRIGRTLGSRPNRIAGSSAGTEARPGSGSATPEQACGPPARPTKADHHRSSANPIAIPPPKPAINTRSPSAIFGAASARVIGMDAEPVFP
ncbi:hypothetical protein UA75_23340 [Actinoalloteichus sp. GBA129-24]|uniref:Uncharacterized protein n=1 Tax=Actinoalloteichus fjordicus TaxID=1612552 RepID=A0AAC9LGR7_9PSEU|nr:hypothetical protein UA74_22830 [Actinoalloteichus fjordicus]APU22650.1 hypothetical protein UA75_23340 [Actinoalloteichus sp. GBA129-24]